MAFHLFQEILKLSTEKKKLKRSGYLNEALIYNLKLIKKEKVATKKVQKRSEKEMNKTAEITRVGGL